MDIFELHADIPRQGPGDRTFTRRVFSTLSTLPEKPMILDVGCGSGVPSIELAQCCDGQIISTDVYQPFLDQLSASVKEAGLDDRITPMVQSMDALDFPPNTFDLIWSEGSIFIVGFERGLTLWRPLLKDGGYLVVSEAAWLTPNPPEEIRTFWETAYPSITDIAGNVSRAQNAGYRVLATYVLPQAGWWEYFNPLEKRLEMLSQRCADDPEAMAMIEESRTQMELRRKYEDEYGYVFYVMQKASR